MINKTMPKLEKFIGKTNDELSVFGNVRLGKSNLHTLDLKNEDEFCGMALINCK